MAKNKKKHGAALSEKNAKHYVIKRLEELESEFGNEMRVVAFLVQSEKFREGYRHLDTSDMDAVFAYICDYVVALQEVTCGDDASLKKLALHLIMQGLKELNMHVVVQLVVIGITSYERLQEKMKEGADEAASLYSGTKHTQIEFC